MIGVIQNTKIFEFRDENDLAKSLTLYGNRYNCDIIIIVDTSDKIKGIVNNGYFTFPTNLNEGQKYYIYGTNISEDKEFAKNDILPKRYNWDHGAVSFVYGTQIIPQEISF